MDSYDKVTTDTTASLFSVESSYSVSTHSSATNPNFVPKSYDGGFSLSSETLSYDSGINFKGSDLAYYWFYQSITVAYDSQSETIIDLPCSQDPSKVIVTHQIDPTTALSWISLQEGGLDEKSKLV